MSLVDKFEGHIGDLVLFSDSEAHNLVGYVRGYTDNKVFLTNMEARNSDGNKRNHKLFGDRMGAEKLYAANLSSWESYEVLKKYESPKSE